MIAVKIAKTVLFCPKISQKINQATLNEFRALGSSQSPMVWNLQHPNPCLISRLKQSSTSLDENKNAKSVRSNLICCIVKL